MTTELEEQPHRVPHLSLREYRSLERDGLVRAVLGKDIFVPAHIPDTPRARVHALRLVLPSALTSVGAVGGLAAAWVMLGGPGPSAVDVFVPPHIRRRVSPPLVLHQAQLPEGHLMSYVGLTMTTPTRTAVDLVRTLAPVQAWQWLDRFAALGVGPMEARACLGEMPFRRGVRQAQRVVDAWGWGERDLASVGIRPAAGDPGHVEDTLDPAHG